MQQVGAFSKSRQDPLSACGVNTEECTKELEAAYEASIKKCLGEPFTADYPRAYAGVREGLKCVSSCGFHRQVPGMTKFFIDQTLEQAILEKEDKQSRSEVVIANRLGDVDLEEQNPLLGFIAVICAYYNPKFSKCVLSRCQSGFLSALDHTDYRHGYEEAMRNALCKEFIDAAAMQSRADYLNEKLQELSEEDASCQAALVKLRQLRA